MQNENVKILKTELLSDNWYQLKKITFEYRKKDGEWEIQEREAYDRGNGATILLINKSRKTVILTKQFRMPTFLNGNPTGMLIETCAGLLEKDNPHECIKKETEEETGFKISKVDKIFEVFMSPGSVTETLHYFIAEYDESMKTGDGGGVMKEQEEIDVLEIPFETSLEMVDRGEIKDAKTIILLYHVRIKGIL